MDIYKLSNSSTCSKLTPIGAPTEQFNSSGIYIGKSSIYSMPISINLDLLVNPHIAVLGMSGSGKTYFLKSVIMRSMLYDGHGVFILDWNGEYQELVTYLGGKSITFNETVDQKIQLDCILKEPECATLLHEREIVCANLAHIQNNEMKALLSTSLLSKIIHDMNKTGITNKIKYLLVIDEAWKLLSGAELHTLFREGRKYGHSVIIATQLAKDIVNEIISNAACVVVFRMQNNDDFSMLQSSGVITAYDIQKIINLERGSCIVTQKLKEHSGAQKQITISKISGFDYAVYILRGNMEFKIMADLFKRNTEKLDTSAENILKIIGYMEHSGRQADLSRFILLLSDMGITRYEIIRYLRSLKISDIAIAEAYLESQNISLA